MGNAASVAEAGRKQGNALYAQHDYAGAVRIYKRAIGAGAEEKHLLYSNLAACYAASGLYSAALEAVDAAVEANPTWPKSHYRRATILVALELWPEAMLALQRALVGEPRNPTIQALIEKVASSMPNAVLRGGGMAYSWGRGEFGALGHNDTKDKSMPKVLDELRGVRLADAACGTGHTLVVSEAGDVWSWGWNSKGQCGLPQGTEAVCVPTMLGSLLGRGVRAVACGAAHSLAVTQSGEVLTWGLGGSGQLGIGDHNTSPIPRAVPGLATEAVQGVACGFGHSVVLTRGGGLFSWGWNRDGQLGVGDTQNRSSPCRLSGMGVLFQHIACGGAHSAVVSTTGQLYTFGSGSCGQLGLGTVQANALRPTLVSKLVDLGVKCALASCGEEFTLAISDTQEVYACGLGNVGQMGSGTDDSFTEPTRVKGMSGHGAESASCGAAQSHAVSTDGKVWVWGQAGTDTSQMLAELRRSSEMDAQVLARLTGGEADDGASAVKQLPGTTPEEVGALKSKRVLRLEAGRRHFVALTAPASALLSELQVPVEWDEMPGCVVVNAGRRQKLMLQVVDSKGKRAASGGERVVARLVWEPGDLVLQGSLPSEDEAASSQEPSKGPPGMAATGAGAAASAGGGPAVPNDPELAAKRASAAARAAATAAATAVDVDADDLMDGRYEICVRPRAEGYHALWVLLNGEHVLGSPRALKVVSSTPVAAKCELRGIVTDVVAGKPAEMHLLLFDEYGNELMSPPSNLPLELAVERSSDALTNSLSVLERSMDILEVRARRPLHAR
eukprot:1585429-Prymnesium_polylepis.1